MYPDGFEWDETKNKINRQKHGIDFNDAAQIFQKQTLDAFDNRKDYGEVRYNSIGQLENGLCIHVTHTERNENIRIISARLANQDERELYAELTRTMEQTPDRENDGVARQTEDAGRNNEESSREIVEDAYFTERTADRER